MSKLTYKMEDASLTTKSYGQLASEEVETKFIGDGYHTIGDLYFHRMILTLALAKRLPLGTVVKSKLHDDGTMFEGDFIIHFTTRAGGFSYHYNLEYWELFQCIPTVPKAPAYDGHEPGDVIRLLSPDSIF